MFDRSRQRSRAPLGLVVVGAVAVAGVWWVSGRPEPAPAPPVEAPEPVPSVVATPQSVRAAVGAALDAEPGGRLFHLDTRAEPSIAVVRMPLPKDDGAWRSRFEAALEAPGWVLSPKGRVLVLSADAGKKLPARAYYIVPVGDEPAPDAVKAATRDRIEALSGTASFAHSPW